ncbi:MAG TPA: uroporphyrinogen decarboxylase family protein [Candidatus Lokiarchaeia archaeon]|nr:uroporphyrinogen decarboxylase family protein [Candidatus Lokiarchaeia archaeon]
MAAMNKFERVMTAFEHRKPDVTPAFILGGDFRFYKQFMDKIGFTPEEMHRYAKDGIMTGAPLCHALSVKLGFDCDWVTLTAMEHFDPETQQVVDTFGERAAFVVNDGVPHLWYNGPFLTSKEKIKAWWDEGRPVDFPLMLMNPSFKLHHTLMSKYDGFTVLIGIPGVYEPLSMGIGLAQVAKFARKEPDFLKEILDRNFTVQEKALEYIVKHKIPIVMCGDDYGYNEGLQISLAQWQKFIKPYLKRYVEIVHSGGAKFALHSCGRIGELFPDFVEIGIDGVESLQPKLNDLPALKQKFGDKITFMGAIDDTDLLVNGTPDQVRAEVRKAVDILGKNGGFIPGGTNFLLDTKIENVQAMVEEIHRPS